MLMAAKFLADELPTRLAHRVAEMEALPFGLSQHPSVLKVKGWYAESFQELLAFSDAIEVHRVDPSSRALLDRLEQEERDHRWFGLGKRLPAWFQGNALPDGKRRELHGLGGLASTAALEKMDGVGAGMGGARAGLGAYDSLPPPRPHQKIYYGNCTTPHLTSSATLYNKHFVDILRRVTKRHEPVTVLTGIRLLTAHHLALSNPSPPPHHIGIISQRANVRKIVQDAVGDASAVVERCLGWCPDVDVDVNPSDDVKGEVEFVGVVELVRSAVFEVLKNGLRAVVEAGGVGTEIKIYITDTGPGIPPAALPRIFDYAYTTAATRPLDPDYQTENEGVSAPMAGYG
ncbi:hypothetical protein HK104_004082, partial [Borealophlyctis nickersoniae]